MEFASGMILGFLLGALAVGLTVWAIHRKASRQQQTDQTQSREMFSALAIQALDENSKRFAEKINALLETRQQFSDQSNKNVLQRLKELTEFSKALEAGRKEAYGAIREQVKGSTEIQQELRKETGSLASALRAPKIRGQWGEMILKNAADLAGMSDHCDYELQVNVAGPEGRLLPDMVVNLPRGGKIVVDAKAPMEAYLESLQAENDAQRNECLSRFGRHIREQMQNLAKKDYWKQFDRTPEFVVMFVPGESFFAAALQADRNLLNDGLKKNVILASPTTFIALLRIVALGWREEAVAQSAQEVSDLGKDLYGRIKVFLSHFVKAGTAIQKSVDSYNKAIASLETRIMPSVRKFQDLGAAPKEPLNTLEPTDSTIRSLNENAEE